ncbi:MAG: SPFH domain-containing protein [Clostridiales bacterium]|nr:SPFH domain-containing protein [Clostridiales bacterium]
MLFFKPEYIQLDKANGDALFVRKEVKPKKRTMVVVDDNHYAIFIKEGVYHNALSTGKYSVLNKGEKNVSKVEFIFLSKTNAIEVKWGTPSRLDMTWQDEHIKVGVSGTFEVQISDPRKVYFEFIQPDKDFSIEKMQDKLRSRMSSEIQPILAKALQESNIAYDQMAQSCTELSDIIKPTVLDMLNKDYGLKLCSFMLDAILVDG